jgi:hypothetical protein
MNSRNGSRSTRAILAIIVIAFLALGVVYSTAVPILEKPDEPGHYFFVQHLVEERSLPVMDGPGQELWDQEGTQPPLYYLLAAGLVSLVEDPDARDLYWENPQANIGNPGRPGNKNFVVHTEAEEWPYEGPVLAIHLARWLSLVMGAGTVVVTFLLVRTLFPQRPGLALGAAAINAFVPQFLFISSSVSNDSLITLLSALGLLQLVRLVDRPGENGWPDTVALGVTLGLAALSKLSGLALLGLAGLVLIWLAWREGSGRPLVRGGLAVGLPVALIAGWWYVRNWQLYGDFTGLAAHLAVTGGRATPMEPGWESLRSELFGLRASFWGLFGWFNILMPDWVYAVLDGLTLLGGVGMVVWWVRDRTVARWKMALPLLWFALVGVSLARWTLMTSASQGRLLFPALPTIALALALGWAEWVPRGWRRARQRAPMAGAAGLLVLAAAAPGWLIEPVYAPPRLMDPEEVPPGLSSPELSFGGKVALHGCETGADGVTPGESLAVTCYWEALVPIEEDYFIYNHLLGRNLDPIGKEHGYPGSGQFPTSLWTVGRVLAATEWISIDQKARTPTLGRVTVGVFEPETGAVLAPTTPAGVALELVVVAEVKVAVLEGRVESIPNPVNYSIGELARLAGYEVEPGDAPRVTLYWEATGGTERDYTVFVHLLDGSEAMWGQGDGPPVGGNYPTRLWEPGEWIVDEHRIAVKEGAPAGEYRIAVGLYSPEDAGRLPVWDAAGAPQAQDRVILPVRLDRE